MWKDHIIGFSTTGLVVEIAYFIFNIVLLFVVKDNHFVLWVNILSCPYMVMGYICAMVGTRGPKGQPGCLISATIILFLGKILSLFDICKQ